MQIYTSIVVAVWVGIWSYQFHTYLWDYFVDFVLNIEQIWDDLTKGIL